MIFHCKDVIPYIANGYAELTKHPEKYKRYEAENGWEQFKVARDSFDKF